MNIKSTDERWQGIQAVASMVEAPKDKSGVFVRGISFAVDQQAVEAAFANVGPIRKCFLIQEKGQEKHKGYGFVQFAIPEDADRAVKELHNTILGDRKIQVLYLTP